MRNRSRAQSINETRICYQLQQSQQLHATYSVESVAHDTVLSVSILDRSWGIAAVLLDVVHAPRGKRLRIQSLVALAAWATCARVCSAIGVDAKLEALQT